MFWFFVRVFRRHYKPLEREQAAGMFFSLPVSMLISAFQNQINDNNKNAFWNKFTLRKKKSFARKCKMVIRGGKNCAVCRPTEERKWNEMQCCLRWFDLLWNCRAFTSDHYISTSNANNWKFIKFNFFEFTASKCASFRDNCVTTKRRARTRKKLNQINSTPSAATECLRHR